MTDQEPRGVVWVGVTGHRVLSDADETTLRARIRELLAGLGEPIGVVSPLAEGADRWVAQEGLALGATLSCPLPFERDLYVQDFEEGASKEEFRALLAQAEAVDTLPTDVTTPAGRTDAYAAVGRAVVERSTVLVAIWDGQAANGRGGPAEIVDVAIRAGMPTVWIHSEAPHDALIWGDDGWEPLDVDRLSAQVRV